MRPVLRFEYPGPSIIKPVLPKVRIYNSNSTPSLGPKVPMRSLRPILARFIFRFLLFNLLSKGF